MMIYYEDLLEYTELINGQDTTGESKYLVSAVEASLLICSL